MESLVKRVTGVVAAGGKGTRLAPITNWVNKHLLPVEECTLMVDYPLRTFRKLGLDTVTVVTGCEHAGQVSEYVADGDRYGFSRINYEVQPSAAGIADVVKRVGHLIGPAGMLLILGDNYFEKDIVLPEKEIFSRSAIAWEYDLKDPKLAKAFGQIVYNDDVPLDIVEKNPNPPHSRILTGLYYFPEDVVSKVAGLNPSQRNELEITDLLKIFLKEKRLHVAQVSGAWRDLGEWDSLSRHIATMRSA